ncbi:MAG: DMT family transporter [Chloroflexota bacterium]
MKLFPHTRAVLQAILVTFLWSTSWVLIKIGLTDLPALTFAGLRYTLAFLCLLPFGLRADARAALRDLSARQWLGLLALGLLYYAITQGTVFVGLAYLPAMTVSFLLTLTAIVVPLFGIAFLAERPTILQWGGVALFTVGAAIFFYPVAIPAGEAFGFVVVLLGVLANSLSAILGRQINHRWNLPPLVVTLVSMGIGASALLFAGVQIEKLPALTWTHWAIIVWLAIVNTAFAFTLWNHTLRTLSATESAIINNTMLVQIAILAWLFLGESFSAPKIVGMILATAGAVIVQIRLTRG